MIWSPMVKTGFSEVIGSWKIIEILLPRMERSSFSESCNRSCFAAPSRMASPSTTRPGGETSPRRE